MAKRVLIVDDAKFMRVILRDILQSAGYEVVGEAETGTQAIQLFRELQPDIMLLDIILPEMEGNIVLSQVLKEFPSAKVLIVSAVGQRLLVDKALKAGAVGYVVKPFNQADILQIVKKVLGEE